MNYEYMQFYYLSFNIYAKSDDDDDAESIFFVS